MRDYNRLRVRPDIAHSPDRRRVGRRMSSMGQFGIGLPVEVSGALLFCL
ncbi:MAG: hypothetical protein ACJ8AI_28485 [Rhodopila sp.]|jgi:hypothetical protein